MNTTSRYLMLAVALFATAFLHADTVKLKFSALAELGASLKEMDGADKPYENVQTNQGAVTRILKVPYDLKTPVRIALAKDLVVVRAALDAFEQKRQRIIAEVSPGAPEKIQIDQALMTKFINAWNIATTEPVTVDLQLISSDDLNLDKNKELPGTVVAGLTPLLKPDK